MGARGKRRAPAGRGHALSEDREHLVARIPRPDGGELHITRRLRKGEPSTRLERYSLDRETGELVPTPRQGLTIRDDALPDVLAALQRISRVALPPSMRSPSNESAKPEPPARSRRLSQPPRRNGKQSPRTGDLTTEDRSKDMDVF
jgi:hypothetical protein